MGQSRSTVVRNAVLHMDRHRERIEVEVNERIGRGEPPPAARAEIVRRFRSFCRLASIDLDAARPSLDGLGGNPPAGLERAVACAVEIACECGASGDIRQALRTLEERFRSGIRQLMHPAGPERRQGRRGRKSPNAGRRVRAAIDRISDAYLALCLDTGQLYDMNPAAESLFGVESRELLEKELAELVSPTHRRKYRDLEARLDAGENSGPLTLVFARPAGDQVAVEMTVALHTIGGRRLAIFLAREVRPANA